MSFSAASTHGTTHEAAVAEAAALERAASGAREVFGAARAFAGLCEPDGSVVFRASAPVGAGIPAPWKRGCVDGVDEALRAGVVVSLPVDHPLSGGSDQGVMVPLTSRGETIGAMVMVWEPDATLPDSAVLALFGVQVGFGLDTLRYCGTLSREIAGLQDAGAVLSSVLAAVPVAVKTLDLDGRVLLWNSACETLYGWTSDEVAGEVMPQLPGDMRLRAVQDIRRIAASGERAAREAVASRKDGTQIAVRIEALPFVDRDGHPAGIVSVTSELTEDGAISGRDDDFITAVSQALKGPLTSIVGFAQLLSRPEILEDAGRRARTVKALEERGNRMAALVEDLLLVTHLDGNRIRLRLEPTDLAGVVAEVVSRFEDGKRRNRFVIDYDASMPPVNADRPRLEQALTNLLDNAIRFSPPRSEIAIGVRHEDGEAVVDVLDRGPGIQPHEKELLFDRFYRGEGDAGADVPGAGLGLYLVKTIAEAHGGSASVTTVEGVGTTFSIRIPADSRLD